MHFNGENMRLTAIGALALLTYIAALIFAQWLELATMP